MTKSHVSLEEKICMVCGHQFDTGATLLDPRMRMVKGGGGCRLAQSMEPKTLTGWGLCGDCQKRHDDGYVALVACDESASVLETDETIKLEGAHRTGQVAHIRRAIWDRVFDVPAPDGPMVFCGAGVVEELAKMMLATPKDPAPEAIQPKR